MGILDEIKGKVESVLHSGKDTAADTTDATSDAANAATDTVTDTASQRRRQCLSGGVGCRRHGFGCGDAGR